MEETLGGMGSGLGGPHKYLIVYWCTLFIVRFVLGVCRRVMVGIWMRPGSQGRIKLSIIPNIFNKCVANNSITNSRYVSINQP